MLFLICVQFIHTLFSWVKMCTVPEIVVVGTCWIVAWHKHSSAYGSVAYKVHYHSASYSFCCVYFILIALFSPLFFILRFLEYVFFFYFSCFCFLHRYLIRLICFLMFAKTLSSSYFIILLFLLSFSSAWGVSAKML